MSSRPAAIVSVGLAGFGRIGCPERRLQQPRDGPDESGGAVICLQPRHRLVSDVVAGAAKSCSDDANRIAGLEPAALEALGERQHVGVAECLLEFGERAEGEAEPVGDAVESGINSMKPNRRRRAASSSEMERSAVFMVPMR